MLCWPTQIVLLIHLIHLNQYLDYGAFALGAYQTTAKLCQSLAWDSEELADAASEKLANAFAGFAEFEYGEPRLVAGDLVYAYTRGS